MFLTRIQPFIKRIMAYERSPRRLALTCAVGIYIGISPFAGFHTAMIFIFGWAFALSIPVLFAVSVLIHNPWTMMPVYAIDHIFGKWLFALLNIDHAQWDPVWIETFNLFLQKHTGIAGLSLSAFLIGGNVLAISTGVMFYPLMKRIFTKYLSKDSHESKDSLHREVQQKNRPEAIKMSSYPSTSSGRTEKKIKNNRTIYD